MDRPFPKSHHEHHLPHFHEEVVKVTGSQRDLDDVFKNSVRIMHVISKVISKVIWETITMTISQNEVSVVNNIINEDHTTYTK